MPIKNIVPNNLGIYEDWEGNAVALRCPLCGKVFIVASTCFHGSKKKCPNCGKSTGYCDIKWNKVATLEW